MTGASWMMFMLGVYVKEDRVSLVSLEQRDDEDRAQAGLRRKACVPLAVRGATGSQAAVINGSSFPPFYPII